MTQPFSAIAFALLAWVGLDVERDRVAGCGVGVADGAAVINSDGPLG